MPILKQLAHRSLLLLCRTVTIRTQDTLCTDHKKATLVLIYSISIGVTQRLSIASPLKHQWMLSVHQALVPSLQGFLSFRRPPQCLTRVWRLQCRARHDDSHATATPPSLPKPAARAAPAHQKALFPVEVLEYIRNHEPTVKEEEISAIQESAALHIGSANRRSPPRKALDRALSIFLPSFARRKVDLSHTNALRWQDNSQELKEPATTIFRDVDGLRRILLDYLQNVEPLFSGGFDEQALLLALQNTFSGDALNLLEKAGNDVTDVVSWVWVFSSEKVDLAIARYVALAADVRKTQHGRIPKFVPLQLLRAEDVSAYALKEFVKSILADLQSCLDVEEYTGWNGVTRVSLVVRLLRHARQVAPGSLEDVAVIIKHLFSDYYTVHPRELESPESQRLCHIFNRFLSLISLAPPKTPFNAYPFQQNAQLNVLRLMFAFEPQLYLLREGYRALIAVQLLHHKTPHERAWAEAKSLSWPPWRKIKSGIERDLEFPGKESRVIKLLRRMQEAGYTLGDWEKSAGVLAGWDTDRSPTIQTRGILMRQRRPWLLAMPWRSWLMSQDSQIADERRSTDAPILWAARIRATRTTREAWASFRSYEKAHQNFTPHYAPYFAMLDKLLASAVRPGATLEWNHLPGDIKESFGVSNNLRELIYIDTDVPSSDEFYQRMLQASIKPGGDLMANLLKHSSSLEAGFTYIQDSRWSEITKDVLRNAEKYPRTIVRDSLNKLPIHTLAAFVYLLCRSAPSNVLTFRNCGSFNVVPRRLRGSDDNEITSFAYATQLLLAADVSDIRVWNGLLHGTAVGFEKYLIQKGVVLGTAWWRRMRLFQWLEKMHTDLHLNLESFRHQAKILQLMLEHVDTRIPPEKIGSLAKATFVEAVYGRKLNEFLPSRDKHLQVVPDVEDLKQLVRVLVSLYDSKGLLALLRWVNEHAGTFRSMDRGLRFEPQNAVDGVATDRHQTLPTHLVDVLCAVRLFLDRNIDWSASRADREVGDGTFHSPIHSDPAVLQQARDFCGVLGWPSDKDVVAFFADNTAWVNKVQRAAEMMARRNSGSSNKPVRE